MAETTGNCKSACDLSGVGILITLHYPLNLPVFKSEALLFMGQSPLKSLLIKFRLLHLLLLFCVIQFLQPTAVVFADFTAFYQDARLLINEATVGFIPIVHDAKSAEWKARTVVVFKKISPQLNEEGITYIGRELGALDYIGSKELVSGNISSEFDPVSMTIRLNIPPQFLQPVYIDIQPTYKYPEQSFVYQPGFLSGFLNISYSQSAVTENHVKSSLLAGTLQMGPFSLRGQTHFNDQYDQKWLINPLYVFMEDVPNLYRYSFGDLYTDSIGFQQAVNVSGFRFEKRLQLDPDRDITPRYLRKIMVEQPALITIKVNEEIVFKRRVDIGYYVIHNPPLAPGNNQIEIQVASAESKPIIYQDSLFYHPNLLQPGMNHYSCTVGYPNQITGNIKDVDYDFPIMSLNWRGGLTSDICLGVHYESDYHQWVSGTSLEWATLFGLWRIDGAASQLADQSVIGTAYKISIVHLLFERHFFPDWGVTYWNYSSDFRLFHPAMPDQPNTTGILASATVGIWDHYQLSTHYYTQFNPDTNENDQGVFFIISSDWNIRENTNFRYYQDMATQNTTLLVKHTWEMPDQQNAASLFLNSIDMKNTDYYGAKWQYHPNSIVNMHTEFKKSNEYFSFENQTKLMHQNWGILSDLTIFSASDTSNYLGQIAVNTPRGILQGGVYKGLEMQASELSSQVRLDTAIAFAGGQWAICRPIRRNFIIVASPADVENSPINVNSIYSTDWFGPAVITDVPSYRLYKLDVTSINQSSLLFTPPQTSFMTYLREGTGIGITFGNGRSVIVRGILSGPNNKPLALEHGYVIPEDKSHEKILFFTDYKGQFECMNMKVGKYHIVFSNQRYAPKVITVSNTLSGIVKLGVLKVMYRQNSKK